MCLCLSSWCSRPSSCIQIGFICNRYLSNWFPSLFDSVESVHTHLSQLYWSFMLCQDLISLWAVGNNKQIIVTEEKQAREALCFLICVSRESWKRPWRIRVFLCVSLYFSSLEHPLSLPIFCYDFTNHFHPQPYFFLSVQLVLYPTILSFHSLLSVFIFQSIFLCHFLFGLANLNVSISVLTHCVL